MKNKIAKLVSKIFYPAITGAAATYVLYFSQLGFNLRAFVCATFFSLCIALFPYLVIKYLIKTGKTPDKDMSIKEDRKYFFKYSFWSYILGFIFLLLAKLPAGLFWVEVGALVFYVVYLLITPYIKISFHTGGLTFNIIAFVLLIDWRFIFLLPLVGLLAWSRLVQKKHSLREVVLGTIVGGVIPVILYFVFV